MSSLDIILNQENETIKVILYEDSLETWQESFNKDAQIKTVFESYSNKANKDFPKELLFKIKPKDVTSEEDQLLNYITGYEENNNPLNLNEVQYIPDVIGKPFSNPFCIFTYIKKEKTLKVMKFDSSINLEELNDYGPSSAYCNGKNLLFISGGEKRDGENVNQFWKIDLKLAQFESFNMATKKNHSMVAIPGDYVFIVGGQNKEAFYFDLNNNKFYGWKKLNKNRIEPALILVNNYLYCFDNMHSNQNENFTFERTDLFSEEHKWEICEPDISSIKMNQKYFGVAKHNDDIIFIGGNLDLEGEEDKDLSERKNFKYNINNNTIEKSDIPYIDYNFKEKTFLKYNDKISYILPDFNRYHPEVMFYQKEKNLIKFLKCYSKKKLEAKEKEEKNIRDFSPIKIGFKINLNQPKEVGNININLNNEFKKEDNKKDNEEDNKEDNNNKEDNKEDNDQNKIENLDNVQPHTFKGKLEFKNENQDINNEQNNEECKNDNVDNKNMEQNEDTKFKNEEIKNNENNMNENNIDNQNNNDFNQNNDYYNYDYNINGNFGGINNNQNQDDNIQSNLIHNQQNEQNVYLSQKDEHKEDQIEDKKEEIKSNNEVPQNDNIEQNEDQNNEIITNDIKLLDDKIKYSHPQTQENVEINTGEIQIDNPEVNLRGKADININDNLNSQNLGISGKEGNQASSIKSINNDAKININLSQQNEETNPKEDIKGSNIPEQNDVLNPELNIKGSNVNMNVNPNINVNVQNNEQMYTNNPPTDIQVNPELNNNGTNVNVQQPEVNPGVSAQIPGDDYEFTMTGIIVGTNDDPANYDKMKAQNPELKIIQPNMDINIQNQNINPTADINAQNPQSNDPNFNIQGQNTNVNVQQPNADPNLNMPSTGVDVNAQGQNTDINAQGPNTDVNAQGQNTDVNAQGQNADVNAQVPNTDVNAQNLEAKLPNEPVIDENGEISWSGIIVGTEEKNPEILKYRVNPNANTGADANMENQVPNVYANENNGNEIDINQNNNLGGGNTEINAQQNGIQASGNVGQVQNPEINVSNKYPNLSVDPNTQIMNTGNVELKGSNQNVDNQQQNINGNIDTNIQGTNTNGQNTPIKLPESTNEGNNLNVNTQMPNAEINGPSANVNADANDNNDSEPLFCITGIIRGTADTNNYPGMNVFEPGANIEINNGNVPESNLNMQSGDPNYNNYQYANVPPNNLDTGGEIKIPDIQITDPKVGGNYTGQINTNLNNNTNQNIELKPIDINMEGNMNVNDNNYNMMNQNIEESINNIGKANLLLLQSNKLTQSKVGNSNVNQSGMINIELNNQNNNNGQSPVFGGKTYVTQYGMNEGK